MAVSDIGDATVAEVGLGQLNVGIPNRFRDAVSAPGRVRWNGKVRTFHSAGFDSTSLLVFIGTFEGRCFLRKCDFSSRLIW